MRLVALVTIVFVVLSVAVQAEEISERSLPGPTPYELDSGSLENPSQELRVVHDEEMTVPGSRWMRVYFGDTKLGEGSFVRITSELDGEVQELDADALAMWSQTSAYFNGDTLRIELVAGPLTDDNQLVVDGLAYDNSDNFQPSLCGADDRVTSEQHFAGRILPNFCSGAIWNEDSCLLSVGHCFDGPTDAQLIEFVVPLNAPNCAHQHPPVNDQFPILDDFWAANGVGNDWAVATVGTNGLGQKPYDRYGEFRPIALEVPPVGTPMTIWGYGSDSECLLDNVQQRSDGQVTALNSLALFHNADTMGGNSGSGVLHNDTIIAAHSHAGCPQNGTTRIDHPSFSLARANLCLPEAGQLTLDTDLYACDGSVLVKLEDRSLIGSSSATVTLTSETEPLGEIFTLDEKYAAVFAETLPLTSAAAVQGDGFLSVSHGDTINVIYADADDGEGGSRIETAIATTDCQPPIISNVQVNEVSFFQATVSWTVDEPATAIMEATGPNGSSQALDQDFALSHTLTVFGLDACSAHTFVVGGEDGVGNFAVEPGDGNQMFETFCTAPPVVPDGNGATQPMRVALEDGQIQVQWDNECTFAGTTKILYGSLQSVSSYNPLGAVCSIPPDADTWPLTGFLLGDLWFLVVKDNGLGQEGAWGQSSLGERNGLDASGFCGSSAKELGGVCP